MPLFKRRTDDGEPGAPADAPSRSRVLSEPDILDRLEEEIVRATRYDRPLVVVCAVPQLLPNQSLGHEEIATAAEAIGVRLRFCDQIGALRDGTLVALLPETDAASARVVAHRLAADLVVRSAGQERRNWRAGVAQVPEDGADPPTVVRAAIARATV